MTNAAITGPAWIPKFLKTLAKTGTVKNAIEAAGVSHGAVYFQRANNLGFSQAWEIAAGGDDAAKADLPKTVLPNTAANAGWRKPFLQHLSETSNVQLSATIANVPPSTVYKLRLTDPEFALQWRRALYEGYEHLEMEVLAHLRGHASELKIDVANAIRQLAAHRKTVAEMRSVEEDVNEQDVLDSIDAKIDRMKAEWAAAEKAQLSNG